MNTKTKKVPVSEIVNLRNALKDFDGTDIPLDLYMDIGIISASLEPILLEYEKAFSKAKDEASKELDVDFKSKELNIFALEKYNSLVNNKMETILKKEYSIESPLFSYKELKDLVNKTKELDNPFKISHKFLSNMNYFIGK